MVGPSVKRGKELLKSSFSYSFPSLASSSFSMDSVFTPVCQFNSVTGGEDKSSPPLKRAFHFLSEVGSPEMKAGVCDLFFFSHSSFMSVVAQNWPFQTANTH